MHINTDFTPPQAQRALAEAQSLTRELTLPDRVGFGSVAEAAALTRVNAELLRELVSLTLLTAEYIRAESEAGRAVAADGGDRLTEARGAVFLAARMATPAMEHAAAALDAMGASAGKLESVQPG